MREIKFRAWRDNFMYEGRSLTEMLSKASIYGFISESEWPVIFMQFTGLHDKNGVEIYSGDIIDLGQTVNGCNIFIVIWDENRAGWNVRYGCEMVEPRNYEYDIAEFFSVDEITGDGPEVIGNIHQNQDLLNA